MTTYNTHDLGDQVRVSVVFTEVATGDAVDPSVVKCSVRDPDGTTTTYVYGTDDEVVKTSTGNYYMDVDADTYGTWYYRWFSTGTGKAGDESLFNVERAKAV